MADKKTVTAEDPVRILGDHQMESFGVLSNYPSQLHFTEIEQRIFAYIFVRSGKPSESLLYTADVLRFRYPHNRISESAYDLRQKEGTTELIEFERKKMLQELRFKTLKVCEKAVTCLENVLDAKSAIARVQAAAAILEIAGVRDPEQDVSQAQNILDSIDEPRRKQIMAALRQSLIDSLGEAPTKHAD